MPSLQVLPSLLSADFARLADECARCAAAGATSLHIDVMDAHFVPNLTIGPCVVEALRRVTPLQLDVHLMMTDPLRYAADFRAAGADAITVHVEAIGPRRMTEAITVLRATGAAVGLAFNPDTDPRLWFKYFAAVDLVMFMMCTLDSVANHSSPRCEISSAPPARLSQHSIFKSMVGSIAPRSPWSLRTGPIASCAAMRFLKMPTRRDSCAGPRDVDVPLGI